MRAWTSFSDLVKEKPLPNAGTSGTQNGFGRGLSPTFLPPVAEATEEGHHSASASRSSESCSGGTFSSLIEMRLRGHTLRYFRVPAPDAESRHSNPHARPAVGRKMSSNGAVGLTQQLNRWRHLV